MDGRIWLGLSLMVGLVASLLGPAPLAEIGALVVAVAVIALTRGEKDYWFVVLAAGALVAVAAGFTSPIWSAVLVLILLGWVEDRFAFLSSRGGKVAYLVFAGVAGAVLVPVMLMRHVLLLFGGLVILLLVSGLFLSLSWYRLVWSARRSEE